jgi:hypothetical protein
MGALGVTLLAGAVIAASITVVARRAVRVRRRAAHANVIRLDFTRAPNLPGSRNDDRNNYRRTTGHRAV